MDRYPRSVTESGPPRLTRYDLDRDRVGALLSDLPRFRADQLWHALYKRFAEPVDAHELPATVRRRLAEMPELSSALIVERELHADAGSTLKWMFSLDGGHRIETVLMHHPRHSTVCVSSQAGCAMDCSFCATGQAGFSRQLSTGEIVEQVVRAARAAEQGKRRLDHVAFMGMGEPLANLKNVWPAVERIIDAIGIGARHVTISTVGVVPGIRALAESGRQVNLAVSLHAANDELRNSLVPLNRRYPLETLVEACASYISATHRRISFEWALIDHVNDRRRDADELASLARRVGAHVNLIPLNPTPLGTAQGLSGSPPFRVASFRAALIERGVNATVRRTRGREIDAACGQLAAGWVPLQSESLGRGAPRFSAGAAVQAVPSGPTAVGPGRLG